MATVESQAPVRPTEPLAVRAKRGGLHFLLLAPALAWALLLVALPLLYLVTTSLWRNSLGDVVHDWNIDNYRDAFTSAVVKTALWRTVVVSIGAASLATFVAYPLAYIVSRKIGRYKLAVALLVLVPLWVSYLMRVFAWRIILGERGVLNGLLMTLGVIDQPSTAFLYSTPTVILTLCYVAIPYVFLSSFVSLERIPNSLVEASGDCGASSTRTFWNVIWPLSLPGAAVGFAIGFVLCFGDYVTPAMVGGLRGTMVGSLVLQQFGYANDWPFGAAIAITILMTALVFLAVVSVFTKSEARFE
jgi:ABC-type spermidine/putrescine transport system permease subunit I